jgi:LuxR family maltose regulon positive regulatory protein
MQAAMRMATGLARFEAQLGRRSAPAVLVAVSLAAAACEQDDFEQMRLLLADRLDLLDPGVLPDAFALGFVAAASLAQHDGDEARARDLLELLLARARARGFARIQAIAIDELVKLNVAAGRLDVCVRLLEALEAASREAGARKSLNAGPITLQLRLVEARVRSASGDADAALAASEAAIELARSLRRRRLEFEARLLRAAAILALTGAPPDDLADLVSLAETLALWRMLREADPALRRWLPQRAAVREAPAACEPTRRGGEAPAGLTAREAEVLRLLSRGLSNREIADALDIGDGTIKWHLKNLFVKFEASDRRRVVARARTLGLIPAE